MRIQWNIPAFEEIRRVPALEPLLQAEVDRVLEAVADVAGNYEGGVESGRNRTRAYVVTADFGAIYHEASEHTLVRALGGRAT